MLKLMNTYYVLHTLHKTLSKKNLNFKISEHKHSQGHKNNIMHKQTTD